MALALSSSRNPGSPNAPSPGARTGARAPQRARPLILVVEDERLTALDLRRRIVDFGCDVVGRAAVTADEAVELARTHRPDLVLMDVRLKGDGDGIEAAQTIRAELGDVPIIYLTAFSNEDTVNRVRALNPAGFIFKPIEVQRLEREISHALNRRKPS